jgi:hypothetical protein
MLEPHQGGVDSAFVQFQNVAARLLDAPGDAVAVLRSHGVERLQHHQIQRALQQFEFRPAARVTLGHRT